jgi:arginase
MNLHLLLVPYDTACRGWRCGAGPEHLVNAGLIAHLESKGHVVAEVQVIEDDPAEPPAEIRTAFELARRLAVAVRAARAAGRFPLVLAGNCNSAIGTLAGLAPASRAVFWFDAHGDLNTPDTTASGFLDGTGLAAALGLGWRALVASVPGFQAVSPELTWLLGVRDLDPAETDLIGKSPITLVPVERVATQLPEILVSAPLSETQGYLHLDLDVLDPKVGQANSLPVPGGLTVEELTGAIAAIRARTPLGAAAVTCYAPEYDSGEAVCRAAFAAIDAILG